MFHDWRSWRSEAIVFFKGRPYYAKEGEAKEWGGYVK